jgi:hypothetical protein
MAFAQDGPDTMTILIMTFLIKAILITLNTGGIECNGTTYN